MHFLTIISVLLISFGQSSMPKDLSLLQESETLLGIMSQGTDSLQVSQIALSDVEFMKYIYFTLGAVVGASVESSGNIANECLADVASIITSSYHIYYYMMDYMDTNEELALAWSITYMVKGFETWYNIDCVVLQEWKDGLTSNITGTIGGGDSQTTT